MFGRNEEELFSGVDFMSSDARKMAQENWLNLGFHDLLCQANGCGFDTPGQELTIFSGK